MSDERKLLTPRQVAEKLNCSIQTVYRIAGTRELPSVRLSGRGASSKARPMVRVWSDDLDRYLAKQLTVGEDE